MAVQLKPGSRLCSATCDAEVVVIKAPTEPVDLRCGGQPMVPADGERGVCDPATPHDAGSLVGKRYTDDDESLELLCTKAGSGSLSVGDAPLLEKGAKPLPASD